MSRKTTKDLETVELNPVVPPRRALLDWYDKHRRVLPWRALPGEVPDPYRVWLSEIMLQQTTVATVKPRFDAFLDRWPRVEMLAASPLDDVLAEWSGLGYYARARNLHACAVAVVDRHGGKFPNTEKELRDLPGIGAYTAASVSAIAFDRPATVVDGNVERVVARLNAITEPMPSVKPKLRALSVPLFEGDDRERPGDYAQAMMDLGATVCVPAKPRCDRCPWFDQCEGRAACIAHTLPRKAKKQPKPQRVGLHLWLVQQDRILMRRRPEKGLLGGMLELPTGGWQSVVAARDADYPALMNQLPLKGRWRMLPGSVGHTFTHFHLTARIAVPHGEIIEPDGEDWRWVSIDELGDVALPTVTAKMVRHAMAKMAEPDADLFEAAS
ncbi:MAG: A/G-specific adenine glycosylase [Alphaproteobacteria bacterium]|nr:A/G-specific adenine glycosylase [Alphaproteobacteria bacterium SS10]